MKIELCFKGCVSLDELDLSSWNTSEITEFRFIRDMNFLQFAFCREKGLVAGDLPSSPYLQGGPYALIPPEHKEEFNDLK